MFSLSGDKTMKVTQISFKNGGILKTSEFVREQDVS